MAQIFPAGWNAPIVKARAQREVETLEVLQRELPDTYTVYHGVRDCEPALIFPGADGGPEWNQAGSPSSLIVIPAFAQDPTFAWTL